MAINWPHHSLRGCSSASPELDTHSLDSGHQNAHHEACQGELPESPKVQLGLDQRVLSEDVDLRLAGSRLGWCRHIFLNTRVRAEWGPPSSTSTRPCSASENWEDKHSLTSPDRCIDQLPMLAAPQSAPRCSTSRPPFSTRFPFLAPGLLR